MKRETIQNTIRNAVRRGLSAGAFALAALWIAGCGAEMPDLSDEQIGLAGEYAANILLKYDSNHRQRLMSEEDMEKEEKRRAAWAVKPPEISEPETPESQEKPSGAAEGTGEQEKPAEKYGTLEDFYDFSGEVAITYEGYFVCTSYSEEQSDAFSLDAAEGKEILVLKFRLKNNSDALQKLDMISRSDTYRVTVNGEYSRAPLTTFLTNDLSTYQGELMPGEERETALLVEIDQGMEIGSLVIRMKNAQRESSVLLK